MISETLYAEYIKERENFDIIENENCFIIYKIKGDSAFISHSFTRKDLRQRGEMASLLAELCILLRMKNVLLLNATIDLRDVNASRTTLAALKCDFEIKAAENGILYIEVDL